MLELDYEEKAEEKKPDLKPFTVKIRSNGRKLTIRDNRDRFFYPDEWFKFYDKLNKRQKFTFNFLINTGARINEAKHVKIEDVDLERKRMILRVTKVKATMGEKKSRPRIIPMSSQFTKRLKNYIEINNLQPNDTFNILSRFAGNIAMKKALKEAGIKDWYMFSIHNVRKTLETWLMALGIDGLKITSHIGHSMAVASRSYVSADVFSWEEKGKIREIIGDLYAR